MDYTLIILIIIVLAVLWAFIRYRNNKKSETFDNTTIVSDLNPTNSTVTELPLQEINKKIENVDDVIDDLISIENAETPIENPQLIVNRKITWPNQAPEGKYVHSSYVGGQRGNGESELEKQDSYATEMAASINYDKMNNNDLFTGVNEAGNFSSYKTERTKEYTTKELYNPYKLLPGEVNKDWFEVMPEPIKVKNRHLINISRPVGLDTVGSTNKNASWDLRGDIPTPKRIVSPWMNSAIDPHIPTVGLCNESCKL